MTVRPETGSDYSVALSVARNRRVLYQNSTPSFTFSSGPVAILG